MHAKSFLFLLFLAGAIYCRTPEADYYLLAQPAGYVMYDEYAQSPSPDEMRGLLPFSPFRVVKHDVLLGDQITHAVQCSFMQRTFYLVKDDKGRLIGAKGRGGRTIVRDCLPQEDTVEAVAGGLYVQPMEGGGRAIAPGAKMVRIFMSDDRCYVLLIGARPCYGWCTLEPADSWRRLAASRVCKPVASDTHFPSWLLQSVMDKVNRANDAYRAYFTHFNGLTGDEKTVPQWRVESTRDRLRCTLSPQTADDELAASTSELRRQLENLLPGAGCILTGGNGELVISLDRK